MSSRWRTATRALLVPLGCALAASALLTWPLVPRAATHLAGGAGDNLIFYWNLWWFREALFHLRTSPFFTPLLFYPDGASLAYHTTTLLNTLPGAGLGLLLPLPIVYNGLVLASFVLAALATFGLALHVLRRAWCEPRPLDRGLAAFAALAFAFSPFHMAHLGHLNISSLWVFPAVAWAVLRFQVHPSRRRAALLGAALGLCGLADPYYLLAGLLLVPLLALLNARLGPADPRPARGASPSLASLAIAAVACGLCLLPLIVPALQYGSRGLEDVRASGSNDFVADLVAYLLPSPMHPLWGKAMLPAYAPLSGNLAEKVIFPTFTVWLLVLLGWRRRSREARLWGVLALCFIVLSFGPYLHVGGRSGIPVESPRRAELRLPLPKLLLDQLPLASGARAASRFAAVGQLALALVAMLGLSQRAGARGVQLAIASVAFECLALPLPMTRVDIPPAYALLRDAARRDAAPGALLEIPPVHTQDKVYQLYQTQHGLPLLGGRLARGPRGAFDRLHRDPFLARLFDKEPLRSYDGLISLDGLDSLGVRWVMLHAAFDPRIGSIARVLERDFEVVPAPPGEARLLRRRDALTPAREGGAPPPHARPAVAAPDSAVGTASPRPAVPP